MFGFNVRRHEKLSSLYRQIGGSAPLNYVKAIEPNVVKIAAVCWRILLHSRTPSSTGWVTRFIFSVKIIARNYNSHNIRHLFVQKSVVSLRTIPALTIKHHGQKVIAYFALFPPSYAMSIRTIFSFSVVLMLNTATASYIGGPKRCIHFILAIISYQINPGFIFPGNNIVRAQTFSFPAPMDQATRHFVKDWIKIVEAYFSTKSAV